MAMPVSRVILDANLWISFLLSNRLSEFESKLFENQIEVIFSDQLLVEVSDVLSRDKIRRKLRPSDFKYFSYYLNQYVCFVKSETVVNLCRDPKDNYLLALAIDSNADYLLTSDKDLLVLNKIAHTSIMTYSKWVSLHDT